MRHERSRGSVLDLFLILLLVCVVAGAVLRLIDLYADDATVSESADVVLRVDALPIEVVECLSVGEALYNADGTRFGTLVSISHTPARLILEQNGSVFIGSAEENTRVDLTVTVRVRGTRQGALFLRDGRFPLPTNLKLPLYTIRASLHATVIR